MARNGTDFTGIAILLGVLGLGYYFLKPKPAAAKANGYTAPIISFLGGATYQGRPTYTYATPMVSPLQYKTATTTVKSLAGIMESQQRALVKRSGLTQRQITQSEQLAWTARKTGLTDF